MSSGDNMELGQLELGFVLDNPENPFRSQSSVFVQLSLWDSCLQRVGETRSTCDEEAIPAACSILDPTAAQVWQVPRERSPEELNC